MEKTEKIKEICGIMIAILIIAVIIIFIFNKPIKIFIYETDFKNNVRKLEKEYECIQDISFSNKYSSLVEVRLRDEFNEKEYEEQSKTISEITNNIKGLYSEFAIKTLYDVEDECNVFIYASSDKYEIKYDSLIKNEEEYSEEAYLKEKIIDELENNNIEYGNEVIEYLEDISKIEQLKNILNIEKSNCINEIIYLSAMQSYTDGNFDIASKKLSKINNDYKDVSEYKNKCNTLNKLQGTWQGSTKVTNTSYLGNYDIDIIHKWIIDGNYCYNIYSDSQATNTYDKYYFIMKDNSYYISKEKQLSEESILYELNYNDDTLKYKIYGGTMILKKINDNVKLPTTTYIKEPKIGMTKEEVRNSTWGSPNKINKTTTSYGTREQWVYSSNRYLYFDNGILSAIQEY